jgi:hypothetical protein
MKIDTFKKLKEVEDKLSEHIVMQGLTYAQAEAILALIPSVKPDSLCLKWYKPINGAWQTKYRGYTICAYYDTFKIVLDRPTGGTIQFYTKFLDEATLEIDNHIDDNMHVNTCQA